MGVINQKALELLIGTITVFYGILAITIFLLGIDMQFPSTGFAYVILFGIPYSLLGFGIVLMKSKWGRMIISFICIFLSFIASLTWSGVFVEGVISLDMTIGAVVIIPFYIGYLCYMEGD